MIGAGEKNRALVHEQVQMMLEKVGLSQDAMNRFPHQS